MKELYPELSVEKALEGVLSHVEVLESERVPVLEALGRVLAEDIHADMDIPPHANSAMDGYAVVASDTVGASRQEPTRLRIIGDLGAGYVSEKVVQTGTAVRIMTGAPIPTGADAVVRFEETEVEEDWVDIMIEVPVAKNVRSTGEDVRQGELVLSKGSRIRSQEVGMAAAVGSKDVLVVRRPRVGILATGDEVVEIDVQPGPGRIRNSNSYSNAAQVIQCGGIPILLGIARDDTEVLTQKIREGLSRSVDLFVTSGGVSVGDFDIVKTVLAAEGDMTFWRVRMKPGKPLAFGQIQEVPLLGLPGNPVSAMISFELFARPAILKMLGLTEWRRPTIDATLMDEVRRKDDRRHYLRVRVEEREGENYAHLTGEQGSGILKSMVEADGLAIIPEEWDEAPPGSRVSVMMLDCDGLVPAGSSQRPIG